MLKKITVVFSVVIIIVLGYFIIKSKPLKIDLTVIPEAHSFVSLVGEEEVLKFKIIINQTNSYITDMSCLNNAYISDNEEDNLYPITIDSISYLDKQKINKKQYYGYNFTFKSKSLESEFYLEKAYLLLEYKACSLKIFIGSFSSYKVNNYNSNNLRVNHLQGIVNPYEGKKLLVGVKFGFKNESDDEIIISKITPLNKVTKINYCIEFDKAITSQTNINELVNIKYNHANFQEINIDQKVDKDLNLLCTLGYIADCEIDTLGFKIDYELNSKLNSMYFSPFTFYQDHEKTIAIKDLTFYQVPHD